MSDFKKINKTLRKTLEDSLAEPLGDFQLNLVHEELDLANEGWKYKGLMSVKCEGIEGQYSLRLGGYTFGPTLYVGDISALTNNRENFFKIISLNESLAEKLHCEAIVVDFGNNLKDVYFIKQYENLIDNTGVKEL